MVDRFLREVQRMHQLRRDINEMTPEEADELIRDCAMTREDWGEWRNQNQLGLAQFQHAFGKNGEDMLQQFQLPASPFKMGKWLG